MKACRIRRGHSQRAVAKEMSITQQAYSKIESDKSRRGLEFLLDLVRILEVGPAEFFMEDTSVTGTASRFTEVD